jgi:hypothetical protein
MILNNKRDVCESGFINPSLSLASFLYICALIICFL